jgi:hypothetical protein
MSVLASVAVPSIVNNGRRQREQELIWRGNQYVRGIRLFFQKNGRLPQNKEELLKGTLDVHFVRKPFTDPVGQNNADWRFIYVAPSGQLTGSVRYQTLQEMAAAQSGGANAQGLAALFGGAPQQDQRLGVGALGGIGPPGSAVAAGRGGQDAATGARGGASAGARGAGAAGPGGQAPSETGGPGTGGLQPPGPTNVPLQAVDGPVFGASLIGVASKIKQDSLLIYQGEDTYFEWEFIWNPLLGGGLGGTQAPVATPSGAASGGLAGPSGSAGDDTGDSSPFGAPGLGPLQGPGSGRGPVTMPGRGGAGRQ